ncbi:MAG: hypothetical protein WD738_00795 [Pirellulales bacterium]
MMTYQRRTFVVGLLALAVSGCGGSDRSLSPPIMTAARHRHYHVHAVDASHEHVHAKDAALGGHYHWHQHPKKRDVL